MRSVTEPAVRRSSPQTGQFCPRPPRVREAKVSFGSARLALGVNSKPSRSQNECC